jgi:hypothetical protein
MGWKLATGANLIIAVAYLGITFAILRPLFATDQWRSNRLGMATAAIFFTCAVHHGAHAIHMLVPALGFDDPAGLALRQAFHWPVVAWDFVGAGVALYYWSLRRTYGALMHGAKLFDDMKERQRQALELNDNIVQGLVAAEMALRLGEKELGVEAIQGTLIRAREIITNLLGEAGSETELGAGDLVRVGPAEVGKATLP